MRAGTTSEIFLLPKFITGNLCFPLLRRLIRNTNVEVKQEVINNINREMMETNPCNKSVNGGSTIPSRVSRKTKPTDTIVNINGVKVGGSEIVVIAGPCAVESREQLFETARSVRKSGAHILRGGAFKPRSSPYSFQGMGEEGLKLLY